MVFQVIIPIFLLLLTGYLSVLIRLITPEQIKAISALIIKISLPAFLIFALSNKTLNDIWHPSYFIAYGGGSLVIFVLAFCCFKYIFHHTLTPTAVLAMGASMSNTGFIGTAVLSLLIGSHAAIYISLTLILENLLILALMLALAEAGLQEQQKFWILFKKTLVSLIKNPVIIAIIIGMSCIFLGVRPHPLINQSLELLGKTASPLALFVIGGSLVGMGITALNTQTWLLVVFKVLLMPLLIYSLLGILPNVSQEMRHAGTIIAALPMPIAFGIFGQAYGLHERVLTPLMLSTIFGFMGISALIMLWW